MMDSQIDRQTKQNREGVYERQLLQLVTIMTLLQKEKKVGKQNRTEQNRTEQRMCV